MKPFCWLTSYQKNKNLAGAFTPVVRFSLFGPDQKRKQAGPLSVHIGIFDSKPKDSEPKGTVMHSQPDWSGWMTYILRRNLPNTPNNRCVRLKAALRRPISEWQQWPIHWWSAQHCSNLGIIKALFCLRNLTRPTNSTMSQPMMWIWGVAFCLYQ